MGHLLRLRLSLADRAGAFAQAATVIGLHGGNIVSIDVHRGDDQSATDDLVVDFADPPDLADMEQDLAINAATTLLHHQPVSQLGDPVVAGLRAAARLVDRYPVDGDDSLAEWVAALCGPARAWVAAAPEARRHPVGELAVEGRVPVTQKSGAPPAALDGGGEGDVWLAAVPDRGDPPGRVVFVARPLPLPFTATEIERIEALMSLCRFLLAAD